MTQQNEAVQPEPVQTDQPKQTPAAKFGPYSSGSGFIEVSVWKNIRQGQDGERTVFSVSFHRSYKDDQGNWQQTKTLFAADLPPLVLGLQKAYEYILSHRGRGA